VSRVAVRRTTYGDYRAHPTTLLRLRGVAKSTPRAVGVWLGVFILCPYSTCCTFNTSAETSTPTSGHHQLFTYCRALDLGVPRSGVGRTASRARHGASGAGRAQQVPHVIRANPPSHAGVNDTSTFSIRPRIWPCAQPHTHSVASTGSHRVDFRFRPKPEKANDLQGSLHFAHTGIWPCRRKMVDLESHTLSTAQMGPCNQQQDGNLDHYLASCVASGCAPLCNFWHCIYGAHGRRHPNAE